MSENVTLDLTPGEAEFLFDALIVKLPGGFDGMICATTKGGKVIQICPDCKREVYENDRTSAAGHDRKCPRDIRYALIRKLEKVVP